MARTLIISLLLLFTVACGRPEFGSPTGGAVVDVTDDRVPATPDPEPGTGAPAAPCELEEGCDQASDPNEEPPPLGSENTRQHGEFTFDAYRAVDPALANLVISPHTFARSLLVAHAAAAPDSDAAYAIERVVDAYGADFYNEFNFTDQNLDNTYDSALFSMLGAVWIDEGVAVETSFADQVIGYTGMPVRPIDLASAPDDARNQINNWYSVNSNGTISDVVGARALDASSAFVITDATWLSIPWAFEGFDPMRTTNAPFYGADSDVLVPLMQGDFSLEHFGDEQLHAVTLPLQGDFSLIALLPHDFDTLSGSLDEAMLRRIMADSEPSDLTLAFPRFELSSRIALSAIAENLQLADLFADDTAFHAFADGTQLHDAYHRTWISFDENGIQANTTAPPAGPPVDSERLLVRFDRPFFFAVYSASFDQFILLGRVTQL